MIISGSKCLPLKSAGRFRRIRRSVSDRQTGFATHQLEVVVEKLSAVYNLRGFFLENSEHIVGTVVAMANDLAFQPVGTSGPFVLYPASS
jgi:hypothetical protein